MTRANDVPSQEHQGPVPPAAVPWLVVITASAGGIEALSRVLSTLPEDLNAAVAIIQHRLPDAESRLAEILQRHTRLPVREARGGERIASGTIYVARPDLHLTVAPDQRFAYVDGQRIRFVRSSANPMLETAAPVFGRHLIAVVLTGFGKDATDGVQSVTAHGGTVIAQDRESSAHWDMPHAAVKTGAVAHVLPIERIGPAIGTIVTGSHVTVACAPDTATVRRRVRITGVTFEP